MNVHLLTADEMIWPLGSQDSVPYYKVPAGSWGRQIKVDPFPAYAPDRALVEDLVAECHERFPLTGSRADLALLPHDFIDRINGITFEDFDYKGTEETEITWHDGQKSKVYPQTHTIVLAGKRIPIHPAMFRYLVPHEYGHAAFNHARQRLGYRQDEEAKLEAAYMELRGVGAERPKAYSGGKWHLSPGEIIANDFRVLVMGRESEFWPHPGVPKPTPDSPIAEWWAKARAASGGTS